MKGWSTVALKAMEDRPFGGPKTDYYEAKAEARQLWEEGVLPQDAYHRILTALFRHYFMMQIKTHVYMPLNFRPGRITSRQKNWEQQRAQSRGTL